MSMRLGHTDPEYRTYAPREEHIPHYYGDIARQFMVGGAVLMLLTVPFADVDTTIMGIIVVYAVVFIGLAALTSPRSRTVMWIDVVLTALAVVFFEILSVVQYQEFSFTFVLHEAPAVLFMFAFYYSLKSLRAMVLHQIGQEPKPNEFDEPASSADDRSHRMEDAVGNPALDALGHPAAQEDDTAGD